MSTTKNPDGSPRCVQFALPQGWLGIQVRSDEEEEVKMINSSARARPLFSENGFGADIIRFPPGGGVARHTHEGDHMLFVLAGEGVVIIGEYRVLLRPGMSYYIAGNEPHSIHGFSSVDLVLLAVGNKHQPAGSSERLTMVEETKQ